ncbi:MAG: hypothetical protein QFF03_19610 [Pseudomonadota bacterium]|nr:hypothetical protein [Pseudomonadota bacterium]
MNVIVPRSASAAGLTQRALLCALLASRALLAPATSTAADADAPPQAVFVAGIKDPDWKSYKAFLAGMKVFDQAARLAPAAPLRFVLRPRTAQATVVGVTMRIATDDGNSIAVPVDADGTFALPRSEDAAREGGEIVLSKRRNTLSWRPAIHSPGVPADARRMGDLRLECLVRWSIEQADLLALFRASINVFGGPCTSAAIKVDYLSAQPLAAVYLESGARRERLAAKWIELDGHVYLPPVHDSSWPDDTLLRFEYLDGAAKEGGQP